MLFQWYTLSSSYYYRQNHYHTHDYTVIIIYIYHYYYYHFHKTISKQTLAMKKRLSKLFTEIASNTNTNKQFSVSDYLFVSTNFARRYYHSITYNHIHIIIILLLRRIDIPESAIILGITIIINIFIINIIIINIIIINIIIIMQPIRQSSLKTILILFKNHMKVILVMMIPIVVVLIIL